MCLGSRISKQTDELLTESVEALARVLAALLTSIELTSVIRIE